MVSVSASTCARVSGSRASASAAGGGLWGKAERETEERGSSSRSRKRNCCEAGAFFFRCRKRGKRPRRRLRAFATPCTSRASQFHVPRTALQGAGKTTRTGGRGKGLQRGEMRKWIVSPSTRRRGWESARLLARAVCTGSRKKRMIRSRRGNLNAREGRNSFLTFTNSAS